MKSFFEWYLEVTPAASGQETRWRWLHDIPWPAAWPAWLAGAIGVSLAAVILAVSLRDTKRLAWPIRIGLLTLRLSALACLLLFLSGLSILVQRTGLPVMAVLLDTSASMGLEDRYEENERRQKVVRFAGNEHPSRLDLAKSLFASRDGFLLSRISERFRLRLYTFDSELHPLGLPGDTPRQLAQKIAGLESDGPDTRPGPAVRQVLEEFRGEPPAAIVLVTDGITSTSRADSLPAVSRSANGRSVPVVVVATGSRWPARDLRLLEPQVDDVALVDVPLAIRVDIQAFQLEGQQATVSLRVGSDEDDIIAEESITLAGDGVSRSVSLNWVPRREGNHELTIEAILSGEESDRANNSHTSLIRVRREQIQVLLVDGSPRWEFRHLKQTLSREPSISLTSVLQDADALSAGDDTSVLEHFPGNPDALRRFDVVILGDVDPGLISPSSQQHLVDFVRDARGGAILIAGTAHNPTSFRDTPLAQLIPYDIGTSSDLSPGRWRARPTTAGLRSTALFTPPGLSSQAREAILQLPSLEWVASVGSPRPGAAVLLEAVSETGAPHGSDDNSKSLSTFPETSARPVILLQKLGTGSVLFQATDEIWRWRLRTGIGHYDHFWLQAIRLLARDRLRLQGQQAELSTGRREFQPNEEVELTLRIFSTSDLPPPSESPLVRVEQASGSIRDITMTASPGQLGQFRAAFKPTGPGRYHASLTSPSLGESPPSTGFRVVEADRELRQRAVAVADIDQVTRATHGMALTAEDAIQLDRILPSGDPVPLAIDAPIRLWNRWELMLLFGTILVGEWLWRRQCRLV